MVIAKKPTVRNLWDFAAIYDKQLPFVPREDIGCRQVCRASRVTGS